MELYIVGDRSTRYQVKRGEDVLVQGLSSVLDGRLRLVIADRDGLFYGDHVELYHETLGKLAELSYVPGGMLDADLREAQARREVAIAEAMRGPRAVTVAPTHQAAKGRKGRR